MLRSAVLVTCLLLVSFCLSHGLPDFQVSNSGSTAYFFTGLGNNPTLTLTRGQTYTFAVSATGHPFWIKTVQGTGTGNPAPGVTNNGIDSGTITYDVPSGQASPVFYNCEFHSLMTGTINLVDPPVSSSSSTGMDVSSSSSSSTGEETSSSSSTGAPGPIEIDVSNVGATAYQINNANNPTLHLTRGQTYMFMINSPGHPFWIKTAQVTGTGSAYNNGLDHNGVDNGMIMWNVSFGVPDPLYYICQFHQAMTGTIMFHDGAFSVSFSMLVIVALALMAIL